MNLCIFGMQNDTYAFLDKLVNDTASPNKTNLLYFGTEIPRIINATIKAMKASNENTTSFEKLQPLVKKSIQSLDNLLASKQEWGQLPQVLINLSKFIVT